MAHLLARSTGSGGLEVLAHLTTTILVGTWLLCATATVRALVKR